MVAAVEYLTLCRENKKAYFVVKLTDHIKECVSHYRNDKSRECAAILKTDKCEWESFTHDMGPSMEP